MKNEMMIHASLHSGMGKIRHNNEDAFYFNGFYLPLDRMDAETDKTDTVSLNGALFAVCDGIGGRNRGELASFMAVSTMQRLQSELTGHDFTATLQKWVGETDRKIGGACGGGGCTLALLYFSSDMVYYAHAGDSRVYRVHNGKLIRLTQDHSKVQILISAGMITPEEALVHPAKHTITRFLGMDMDSVVCEATVGHPLPAIPGDRYMICSDGVTDMLDDARMCSYLSCEGDGDSLSDRIYSAAIEAGGRDNTTVIVLDIIGDGNPTQQDEIIDEDDEPTVDDDKPSWGSGHLTKLHTTTNVTLSTSRASHKISVDIRLSTGAKG